MKKIKIKEAKPRDTWIPATWRYNGAGLHKDKKKEQAKFAARKSKTA